VPVTRHGTRATSPLACDAGDPASPLADAGQSRVTLSTSVPDGTETTSAATGTTSVCNVAGLCSTAGPVGGMHVDRKAPTLACSAPPAAWQPDNATVTCTSTDGGSGLADPADATFTLRTSVEAGAESPSASTDSRRVCDQVGNCATAGPYSGPRIDRLAPQVVSDHADGLWHASNVDLTCAHTDNGSGLSSPAR